MTRQEIEVLLSQHSPDESMREAQLADVVRELMEDIEKLKKVVEASTLYAAKAEIEKLNRAYYLLRCEVQSYINEKEVAIFNEIQATKHAENLKREMIQVKYLYNLKCEEIQKFKELSIKEKP
jgi:hypothetical protein